MRSAEPARGAPARPRARRHPRALRARAVAGLTLLELLLVMLILAVVAGAGVGVFAELEPSRRGAAGLVHSVLYAARGHARATRAPASVRVVRERGELVAAVQRPVGTWRFEGRSLRGAFGSVGVADPGLFVRDGYIGDALSLGGSADAVAEIPLDDPGGSDLTDGFAVECVLRREGLGGGQVLEVGQAVWLDVGSAGELRGRFAARTATGGSARVSLTSPPGLVHPERWTRVRLRYDRRELLLEVDGVVVARREETAAVRPLEGSIRLSDRTYPFRGSIDDLAIHALALDPPVRLPEGVVLEGGPPVIHFDAGGGLDRRRHPEPVELVLRHEDGTRQAVLVGAYGTVE